MGEDSPSYISLVKIFFFSYWSAILLQELELMIFCFSHSEIEKLPFINLIDFMDLQIIKWNLCLNWKIYLHHCCVLLVYNTFVKRGHCYTFYISFWLRLKDLVYGSRYMIFSKCYRISSSILLLLWNQYFLLYQIYGKQILSFMNMLSFKNVWIAIKLFVL